MSPHPIRFGIMPSAQGCDWPAFRRAALDAEALGAESLWVSDHITAPRPWPRGGSLDALGVLGALAECTNTALVGAMVHPVSLRQPALLLKTLTTIEHVSGGRLYMGLGAGWFESEHVEAGIEFKSAKQRVADLADAVRLFRAGPGDTEARTRIQAPFRDFENVPSPVWPPRIMIGGAGPSTLKVVAEGADAWNVIGSYEQVTTALHRLRAECAAIGRSFDELELSLHAGPVVIRESTEAALEVAREQYRANGFATGPDDEVVSTIPSPSLRPRSIGTSEDVVANLTMFGELGFTHYYFDLLSPYDSETLERLLVDVRGALGGRFDEKVSA